MITIKNLSRYYAAGMVHALKNVSLEISVGEICSIMGPSGCGKSTLLNMIGALDKPSSGKIFIKQRPLESFPLNIYRNRMTGFIFQLHNLLPNYTLIENVALPLKARKKVGSRESFEMAMAMLSELGLAHRACFFPASVSGGERQRAAVARGLINEPEILLADEPTGSVDSHTSTLIMDAILRRCEKNGMTMLVVTHNPDVAGRTSRVISMLDGQVVSD